MRRIKFKNYYQRFIIASLGVLLFMTFFQSMIYYSFSRGQFRGYVSEIADLILDDIELNLDSYFGTLNEKLDLIYQEPGFLATLNDEGIEPTESYARQLVTNTKYFRALSGTYIYNRSNELRSGYRRLKEPYAFDVIAEQDAAAQDVLRYIAEGTTKLTVLCCQDGTGHTYLRTVKRLYQDAGYSEVGYIICDFEPTALCEIVQDCVRTAEQSVWILSENGRGCFLSDAANESALAFMQKHPELSEEFTEGVMVGDNHYCQSKLSAYGTAVCIFTDGAGLRRNYGKVLEVLCQSSLLVLILFIGFGYVMSRRINRRTDVLTGILARIADGERNLRLPVEGQDEISAICRSFNAMMDQLDVRTAMEEEMQRALNDARYHALQSQVNPHFLYNTMETIGAIALSQKCRIVDDMCEALAKMMRYSIEMEEKWVTLRQELDYVKEYMLIIGVRMQNQIRMEVHIDDRLWGTEMPRLSIQPLVENAVRHGLKEKRGEKRIEIAAGLDGEVVRLTVRDNGVGITKERLEQLSNHERVQSEVHTSIGIRNINQRIQLLCGTEYGLSVEAGDGWTLVTMKLPYRKEEEIWADGHS